MAFVIVVIQENYPLRVPGPRGTEGRTWSVIDRWPTHPLLIKVPIILVQPDSTCLDICQTFAENIKKELATFPEEKRGKVSLIAPILPLFTVDSLHLHF